MNIHNTKLPPLPKLPMNDPAAAHKILNDYGKACARAAIEADRQRRGEPVAFAKDGNLFWYGDPVAWREFSGELCLAPQPTDPVVKDSLTVADGWQLVPKVPTEEMLHALMEWDVEAGITPRAEYQAMLAAAPKFGEEE